MAQSSRIRVKRSAVPGKIPTTNDLELAEIAINTHDGQMFIKRDRSGNQSVVPLGAIDATDRVFFVAKTGLDTNDGRTIGQAFNTLDKAITAVEQDRQQFLSSNPSEKYRATIYLKTGEYTVSNPLKLPRNTTIVGDNLRSVSISPANPTEDIFYLTNGCYLTGFTFRDFEAPAAAVAFDPNPGSGDKTITASPYVQNCSCITGTGTGMRIDGSVVNGTKSMVADAFTQYNEGGIGVHLLNKGYAQLVSIFTIACETGILAQSGGQCSLANSNCSFGNFGLKAEGVSEVLNTGTVSGSYVDGDTVVDIISDPPPRFGQAIKFGGSDRFYTVKDIEDLGGDLYRTTLQQSLEESVGDEANVQFFQRSLITASSITFEYVGAGTEIPSALPQNGGFPVQENEVVEDEDFGGQVFFTSTDQDGDFRIGGELTINRDEGTISGVAFDRSLFNVLTPFILALED